MTIKKGGNGDGFRIGPLRKAKKEPIYCNGGFAPKPPGFFALKGENDKFENSGKIKARAGIYSAKVKQGQRAKRTKSLQTAQLRQHPADTPLKS